MKRRDKWFVPVMIVIACIFFTASSGLAADCDDYEVVTSYLDQLVDEGKIASWSDFTSPHIPEGHCGFKIDFIQPVDHEDPLGPTFIQTIVLDHGSLDAPTVFRTSGYYMWHDRREPSRILNANQLSAGHRYFGDIDPLVHGYDYLNEYQAASDHNSITLAFAPFYSGAFLVSGISKGGEMLRFFSIIIREPTETKSTGPFPMWLPSAVPGLTNDIVSTWNAN